jgi:hypothetical protein
MLHMCVAYTLWISANRYYAWACLCVHLNAFTQSMYVYLLPQNIKILWPLLLMVAYSADCHGFVPKFAHPFSQQVQNPQGMIQPSAVSSEWPIEMNQESKNHNPDDFCFKIVPFSIVCNNHGSRTWDDFNRTQQSLSILMFSEQTVPLTLIRTPMSRHLWNISGRKSCLSSKSMQISPQVFRRMASKGAPGIQWLINAVAMCSCRREPTSCRISHNHW